MSETQLYASSPAEAGLDPVKVAALLDRAQREVREGLLPSCQVAIARHGKIGAAAAFGEAVQGGVTKPATNETLYVAFSCAKGLFSAATWLLIQDGKLDVTQPVVRYVPEFGTNGKEAVTVEQLFLHVGGFPDAPYAQREWLDRAARMRRFQSWRLQFPAGKEYAYHATSAHWVMAEIVERLSGMDFREFFRLRVAEPLGLPNLRMGLPRDQQHRQAQLTYVGAPMTAEEMKQRGINVVMPTEINEETILGFNKPEVLEAGCPGGGAVVTAGALAMFYQALVNGGRAPDGKQIWREELLRDVLRICTEGYFDRLFRVQPNRCLGMVVAGGDGKAGVRGFGKTNSADAFGHNGAGGQVAWADPATGISFGYCTNGFDRNDVRQGKRVVAISSMAAVCAAGEREGS
ncbi:MAG: beta-lactamase family protein [Deltaproteobacteria bacterium]|nr:beta-lactamase family protein [Deltaproteobacteria bacterium]